MSGSGSLTGLQLGTSQLCSLKLSQSSTTGGSAFKLTSTDAGRFWVPGGLLQKTVLTWQPASLQQEQRGERKIEASLGSLTSEVTSLVVNLTVSHSLEASYQVQPTLKGMGSHKGLTRRGWAIVNRFRTIPPHIPTHPLELAHPNTPKCRQGPQVWANPNSILLPPLTPCISRLQSVEGASSISSIWEPHRNVCSQAPPQTKGMRNSGGPAPASCSTSRGGSSM